MTKMTYIDGISKKGFWEIASQKPFFRLSKNRFAGLF